MNKLVFLIIFPLLLISLNSKAAVFDVEARGVYGGFWRDLYKLGPVVADTIGADMGVFTSSSFKVGFSFATLVGLLSNDPDHDVFDAFSENPYEYNGVLNPLVPADFSYSTIALKLEYIIYEGSSFGWSTTVNFGDGVLAFRPEADEKKGDSLSHNYGSLGTALIIKITKNLRTSIGVSYRKDFDANESSRQDGYENFDAVTIYNHVYLVKF